MINDKNKLNKIHQLNYSKNYPEFGFQRLQLNVHWFPGLRCLQQKTMHHCATFFFLRNYV